ncbi:MAG: GSCFA domain-containing protein [Muribaculaceae bacterium]|nr:GSCFA domain-containing protein [Muribaculaceae bacterium]
MKFRTELTPANPAGLRIDPTLPIALVGSCFSANIARRMCEHLWRAVNPFGALYNPESIRKVISLSLATAAGVSRPLHEFCADGVWHSWLLDSSFSAESADELSERFRTAASEFMEALATGGTLCVTFGTAWVYDLVTDRLTVGNCHKQRDTLFARRRLSVDEIVGAWLPLIDMLADRLPGLNIVFTVSPVRHLKDGFEGNARSKAILLLAIEQICAARSNCHYFPAYELLTDDLRDYRYYAADLTHPADQAVEYIWEKFRDTYIDAEGVRFLRDGAALCAGLRHRPVMRTGPLGHQLEAVRKARLNEQLAEFLTRWPFALDPRK